MAKSLPISNKPSPLTLACFVFVLLVVEMEKEVVLPALPDMLKALSISYTVTQSVIYINFAGFCCSCLFVGHLTRALGYKRLSQYASLVFLVGSALTCIFDSISCIIIGRFLQGAAGSMLFINLYALIAVIYERKMAARVLGYVNGTICFMTGGAPLLGAVLVNAYGWKSSFLSIALLSIFSFFAATLGFHQGRASLLAHSMPRHESLREGYLGLLKKFDFLRLTFIPAFMCASYMVYLSFLPFLLIEHLKVSRIYYGLSQAAVLVAFSIPCFFSSRICQWVGTERAERWGVVGSAILGIIYAAALFYDKWGALHLSIIGVLFFGFQGIPYSNYISYAINTTRGSEGLASALGMFFRLGFSAVGIWISSSLSSNVILNVAVILLALNIATLLVYRHGKKNLQAHRTTLETTGSDLSLLH